MPFPSIWSSSPVAPLLWVLPDDEARTLAEREGPPASEVTVSSVLHGPLPHHPGPVASSSCVMTQVNRKLESEPSNFKGDNHPSRAKRLLA